MYHIHFTVNKSQKEQIAELQEAQGYASQSAVLRDALRILHEMYISNQS